MNLGDIQVTIEESLVLARLSGEIDLSNAQSIEEAIALSTPNDAIRVVLDMTEVDYIDSAGIQIVYRLQEKLGNRGQQLKLVVPADSAATDALRLAGVIDHLDITATLEDAISFSDEED